MDAIRTALFFGTPIRYVVSVMSPETKFELQLVHFSEPKTVGLFLLDTEGYECYLTLRCELGEFQAKQWNFFDALCLIRQELEELGWRPHCYGSSRAVYPSNMCRDQGRGMVAYRMEMGRVASQDDLVEIFQTGPDIELASVEEQRKFYEDWRKSLED